MEDNPYSAFLGVIRKDSDDRSVPVWCLGVVVSTAPLAVRTGTLTLTGDALLVNYQLRENIEKAALMNVSGEVDASSHCEQGGSLSKLTVTGGTLKAQAVFGGVLAVGDQVAMLRSEDGQQYLVLCKVVNA